MPTLSKRLEDLITASILRTPEPLARLLFGRVPRNDYGAPLDRQIHILLELIERAERPALNELTLPDARDQYEAVTRSMDVPHEPMETVRQIRFEGPNGQIPAVLYRPSRAETLPACVFYHGGGFTVGSAKGYEGVARLLAARSGCAVINVDYRLAPEHPFPAGITDAIAAFTKTLERADEFGIDPHRVAVAGDSAGATLATVVAQQRLLDGALGPALQLLVYPATSHRGDFTSRRFFGRRLLPHR